MIIKPWLTAMHRHKHSAPVNVLLNKNIFTINSKILDYGCGHADDVTLLKGKGYNISGYDKYLEPYTNPAVLQDKYDIVTCLYVLNTIEDLEERVLVLSNIFNALTDTGQAYIAVRSEAEFDKNKSTNVTKYKDGIVTSKSTFQKYFSKEDLDTLLQSFPEVSYEYIKFPKNSLFIKAQQRGEQ